MPQNIKIPIKCLTIKLMEKKRNEENEEKTTMYTTIKSFKINKINTKIKCFVCNMLVEVIILLAMYFNNEICY